MNIPFSGIARTPPIAFDRDSASRALEKIAKIMPMLKRDERALLEGAAGCSPYLARLIGSHEDAVVDLLRQPVDVSLRANITQLKLAVSAANKADRYAILRKTKNKVALAIALGDLGGTLSVMEAARAHSQFADAAIEVAFRAACVECKIDPAVMTGVAMIAMGKHGGMEVNYSSDVDLIAIYDAPSMPEVLREESGRHATNITKTMVDLLQRQTVDGYVYRTDLRLRPDPGVSPLAVSMAAAEAYYEAFGQNWERMAFIRARASAGDIALGQRFLDALRPYIWRRYLDFAAIDDVKAIKRQIHSAKGGAKVDFAGHDLKTGRGGIREVEFFAQTQQLILGGKDVTLRVRNTIEALAALRAAGQLTAEKEEMLVAAYHDLRLVEHRLQMINDEQTHKLPESEAHIERLAKFCGRDDVDGFRDELLTVLHAVRDEYDDLFSADARAEDSGRHAINGSMVFTGVDDDADTIATLTRLGFARPHDVSATIRKWHTGVIRATRNERARILLTKLINPLMQALAKAGNADDAFFAFDRFVSDLPAGVQVFSLLLNKPSIFDALIKIMTLSPYVARAFSADAKHVELLIEDKWSEPLAPLFDDGAAEPYVDFEHSLNAVRMIANERRLLITAQLVTGVVTPELAEKNFTDLADYCLLDLQRAAHHEMQKRYGAIDGELAVLSLGRLGAGEMTAASDVDLVFIYHAEEGAQSDGERSVSANEYFGKLVRRVITGLSAPGRAGQLYDVDMQLRPSGRAGPAAVSIRAFKKYYEADAWTWEVMALCRARLVTGTPALSKEISGAIEAIIRRPRDRNTLASDIQDMRTRLLKEKPADSVWDIKNAAGGVTDIAFICQYLTLLGGARFGPAPTSTADAITWLTEKGALSQTDRETLTDAFGLYNNLTHILRAATGGSFDIEATGANLRMRLCDVLGVETINDAMRALETRQSAVSSLFEKHVCQ